MSIDSFFHSNPVFRYNDFIQWRGAVSKIDLHNARMLLQHYTKVGRISSIRRGLYIVIPPGESKDELFVDPYLIAGKVADDSVLAYHTALELHGVAYSVFEQYTLVTAKKIKPFQFQQRWYQPVAVSASIKNSKNVEVATIDRQGASIQVTTLERTFVDILDRTDLSGGWEEVCRSINNIAVLNIEKAVQYCLLRNNRILAAKVGFFLEQRQGAFTVSDDILKPLQILKPKTPQYLAHEKPKQLIKQWNLIVPKSILEQRWEEPDHEI